MMNEVQQKSWNEFVTRNGGSFLQSWEWGIFQESISRKIWRLENNTFRSLIIKHELPLGLSYLYCPRGPVLESNIKNPRSNPFGMLRGRQISKIQIKNHKKHILQIFIRHAQEIVRDEKAIFLRIDPEREIQNQISKAKYQKLLEEVGFRKAPKEVQPKRTLIIDLMKSKEELLNEMHPKTRYNIRIAERHGIKVLRSKSQMYFEEFWRLLQETARRDTFSLHPKEYYQKQLSPSSSESSSNPTRFYNGRYKNEKGFSNELIVAEYRNQVVAAAIVNFWNKKATYLHGASDYRRRHLMAPHLLHWEIMKEAKQRGCREYDMWGIDEKKWPGLTRFKRSFGGKEVEYIGAWDFVFQKPTHTVYEILTRLKHVLS